MRTWVKSSTVCTMSGMPPHAYAALIFASASPFLPSADRGTWTQVSRGIEISCAPDRSAGRCATMIVSLREPVVFSGSRESLPRSSRFSALAAAASFSGRDSSGTSVNASTLSMLFSTERT